jgi:large subunit ribosomal protein L29
MEIKELKKKSESDLHKLLNESREKLRDLRFKDASKQLKNVREIREIRVTIAQILTLLNNKKETGIKNQELGQDLNK